jgi:hypothetical protein
LWLPSADAHLTGAPNVKKSMSPASALQAPPDRLGRDADRRDRVEELAMRDAEMLAPPAHLPVLGEIDRELRQRSPWSRMATALARRLYRRSHARRAQARACDASAIRLRRAPRASPDESAMPVAIGAGAIIVFLASVRDAAPLLGAVIGERDKTAGNARDEAAEKRRRAV